VEYQAFLQNYQDDKLARKAQKRLKEIKEKQSKMTE
jgi:hypothetical protein